MVQKPHCHRFRDLPRDKMGRDLIPQLFQGSGMRKNFVRSRALPYEHLNFCLHLSTKDQSKSDAPKTSSSQINPSFPLLSHISIHPSIRSSSCSRRGTGPCSRLCPRACRPGSRWPCPSRRASLFLWSVDRGSCQRCIGQA